MSREGGYEGGFCGIMSLLFFFFFLVLIPWKGIDFESGGLFLSLFYKLARERERGSSTGHHIKAWFYFLFSFFGIDRMERVLVLTEAAFLGMFYQWVGEREKGSRITSIDEGQVWRIATVWQ